MKGFLIMNKENIDSVELGELMLCIDEHGWNSQLDFLFGEEMREHGIDTDGNVNEQLLQMADIDTEAIAEVGFAVALIVVTVTISVMLAHSARHKIVNTYMYILADPYWKRMPNNVFDAPYVFDEMRIPEYDKLLTCVRGINDMFTYLKSLNGVIPSGDTMASFEAAIPDISVGNLKDDPYALGYDSTEKLSVLREAVLDMHVSRNQLSKVYKSTKKKIKPKVLSKLRPEEKEYLRKVDSALATVVCAYSIALNFTVELLLTSKWVGNNIPTAKRLLAEREREKAEALAAEIASQSEYKKLCYKI